MIYYARAKSWSRKIHGANTMEEALEIAVMASNDCLDHTDAISIYDAEGDYLCGEQD